MADSGDSGALRLLDVGCSHQPLSGALLNPNLYKFCLGVLNSRTTTEVLFLSFLGVFVISMNRKGYPIALQIIVSELS